MNAFKDLKSTYLKNTRKMFGKDLNNRTEKEWGHIEVTQAVDRNGNDLVQNQEYFNVRYQVKPFMLWIWLSVLLVSFGGLVSFFKRNKHEK